MQYPADFTHSILIPSPDTLGYRSPKDTPANPRLGALSIDFSRILPRTFRIRLVRVLKSLRKPFALWPLIAAFARPFRTVARHGSGRVQLAPKLKRPMPAWSLLIVLLVGAGVGFYASTIFSEVAGIGQSTAPDFTIGTNLSLWPRRKAA